jgi:hypothetical protein
MLRRFTLCLLYIAPENFGKPLATSTPHAGGHLGDFLYTVAILLSGLIKIRTPGLLGFVTLSIVRNSEY